MFWRIWKDKPRAAIGKDLNNEDKGWREGFPAKFRRWNWNMETWIRRRLGEVQLKPSDAGSDFFPA
ncbi:hypothetical protein JAAARDRAFT_41000 [Jaapia argillacea MUCL 33604]|uniref:Uncharacterized protein n=1 Tax=Jaapia argillacea MUCL 33604 TaxID=933084 RepID=A0A067PMQ9_9AGAM|nr:hypothetical protein JAAARDRAFT_41000 [Jaapia argillacea MUCL 33604]